MNAVLRFLRRELVFMLEGITHLHSDHAIHGLGPPRSRP
jgi:hypothetical protein